NFPLSHSSFAIFFPILASTDLLSLPLYPPSLMMSTVVEERTDPSDYEVSRKRPLEEDQQDDEPQRSDQNHIQPGSEDNVNQDGDGHSADNAKEDADNVELIFCLLKLNGTFPSCLF
ncbi:hypothetical protein BKA69DRAFT_1056399, partial [Paraphysoderma sedebokerense]